MPPKRNDDDLSNHLLAFLRETISDLRADIVKLQNEQRRQRGSLERSNASVEELQIDRKRRYKERIILITSAITALSAIVVALIQVFGSH